MYVIKDLVPDMNNFYTQYRSIQPWLQRKDEKKSANQQYLQSVDDRKKLASFKSCSTGLKLAIILVPVAATPDRRTFLYLML
jgi:succinate dehydrogenase/fumarate reductase-like Fe-S protein